MTGYIWILEAAIFNMWAQIGDSSNPNKPPLDPCELCALARAHVGYFGRDTIPLNNDTLKLVHKIDMNIKSGKNVTKLTSCNGNIFNGDRI